MPNKYIIDGSCDHNGKIVIRDSETKEVVAKVSDIPTLGLWLEMNDAEEN